MNKGLEELKNPISCSYDLKTGKALKYEYRKNQIDIIKKELKAPINLINKELRNARKSLPYDNYRCGYIDALITIKKQIKEKENESNINEH